MLVFRLYNQRQKYPTVPGPKRQTSDQNVKTGWYHARQCTLPHFLPQTKGRKKGGRLSSLAWINRFWRFGHSFDVSGRGNWFKKKFYLLMRYLMCIPSYNDMQVCNDFGCIKFSFSQISICQKRQNSIWKCFINLN